MSAAPSRIPEVETRASLNGALTRDDFDLGKVPSFQLSSLTRSKPKWWHWGAIAFVLYYMPPAVASIVDRNFWPSEGYLKFIHDKTPARTYYYGTDAVHALIAIIGALVGAALFALAYDRFPIVVFALRERRLLTAPDTAVRHELRRMKRIFRHPLVQIGLLLPSIYAAYSIYLVTTTHSDDWWGGAGHAKVGIAFVITSWLMVYVGGSAIVCLAVGLYGLGRLFAYGVRLEPLHSDECNGFGMFGNYLVLLFCCALTIASAGWITIGSNYLGLATLPGTWMAISVGIFAIPVFLLWPLLACTLQIMRARDDRVAPLQAALDRALVEFEVQAQTERRELPQLSEGLQKFATARDAIARVFPANPFPFKPRLIGTLSLGYLVQLVLFAKKVVEALR